MSRGGGRTQKKGEPAGFGCGLAQGADKPDASLAMEVQEKSETMSGLARCTKLTKGVPCIHEYSKFGAGFRTREPRGFDGRNRLHING
jgi:hypothetical protein